MKELITDWQRDKLEGSMKLCFLAAVFTSFFGSAILPVTVPGMGEIFPFRVFLALAAVLYLVWAIREKGCFWKGASTLENWCYLLIAIMLVYSVVSLFRAIDFMFTFRKLFNLCFDLCFFFLLLRLCRDKRMLRYTLYLSLAAASIMAVMGVYEIFNGGIFNSKYDVGTYFSLFMTYYQFPLTVSSTCNEYAGTMLFVGSSVWLFWAAGRKDAIPRWQLWAAALTIPFVWFLELASSARLCQAAFCILLAGVTVWFLCRGRRQIWVPVVAILLIFCVQFANQYRFIVPPIQQYMAQMKEYREQVNQEPTPVEPTPTEPATPVEKPSLNIGDPREDPLEGQFFQINEETGEKELNSTRSGGVRVRLLLHAFDCLKESKGLGVGLGNTEKLAGQRHVAGNEQSGYYEAIHCFLARIAADYGIFVLIPLCVIGFLLLKRTWALFWSGLKTRDRRLVGLAILYFCTLLIFPIVSTASADAQDLLCMWIYLAAVVLFSAEIPSSQGSEPQNIEGPISV